MLAVPTSASHSARQQSALYLLYIRYITIIYILYLYMNALPPLLSRCQKYIGLCLRRSSFSRENVFHIRFVLLLIFPRLGFFCLTSANVSELFINLFVQWKPNRNSISIDFQLISCATHININWETEILKTITNKLDTLSA